MPSKKSSSSRSDASHHKKSSKTASPIKVTPLDARQRSLLNAITPNNSGPIPSLVTPEDLCAVMLYRGAILINGVRPLPPLPTMEPKKTSETSSAATSSSSSDEGKQNEDLLLKAYRKLEGDRRSYLPAFFRFKVALDDMYMRIDAEKMLVLYQQVDITAMEAAKEGTFVLSLFAVKCLQEFLRPLVTSVTRVKTIEETKCRLLLPALDANQKIFLVSPLLEGANYSKPLSDLLEETGAIKFEKAATDAGKKTLRRYRKTVKATKVRPLPTIPAATFERQATPEISVEIPDLTTPSQPSTSGSGPSQQSSLSESSQALLISSGSFHAMMAKLGTLSSSSNPVALGLSSSSSLSNLLLSSSSCEELLAKLACLSAVSTEPETVVVSDNSETDEAREVSELVQATVKSIKPCSTLRQSATEPRGVLPVDGAPTSHTIKKPEEVISGGSDERLEEEELREDQESPEQRLRIEHSEEEDLLTRLNAVFKQRRQVLSSSSSTGSGQDGDDESSEDEFEEEDDSNKDDLEVSKLVDDLIRCVEDESQLKSSRVEEMLSASSSSNKSDFLSSFSSSSASETVVVPSTSTANLSQNADSSNALEIFSQQITLFLSNLVDKQQSLTIFDRLFHRPMLDPQIKEQAQALVQQLSGFFAEEHTEDDCLALFGHMLVLLSVKHAFFGSYFKQAISAVLLSYAVNLSTMIGLARVVTQKVSDDQDVNCMVANGLAGEPGAPEWRCKSKEDIDQWLQSLNLILSRNDRVSDACQQQLIEALASCRPSFNMLVNQQVNQLFIDDKLTQDQRSIWKNILIDVVSRDVISFSESGHMEKIDIQRAQSMATKIIEASDLQYHESKRVQAQEPLKSASKIGGLTSVSTIPTPPPLPATNSQQLSVPVPPPLPPLTTQPRAKSSSASSSSSSGGSSTSRQDDSNKLPFTGTLFRRKRTKLRPVVSGAVNPAEEQDSFESIMLERYGLMLGLKNKLTDLEEANKASEDSDDDNNWSDDEGTESESGPLPRH